MFVNSPRMLRIPAGRMIAALLLCLIAYQAFGQSNPVPSFGLFPVPPPVGFNTKYVAIADFNGDGKPDMAGTGGRPAADGSGSISVVLGDGNGNFGPPLNSTVNPAPDAFVVADFNGNNRPDLLTLGSQDLSTRSFVILLGGGRAASRKVRSCPRLAETRLTLMAQTSLIL